MGHESNQILTARYMGNNGNLRKFGAPYRVSTNTMFISKCSYKEGQPENIILMWVQRAHNPVRAVKVTAFWLHRIWVIVEIYVNSRHPIATIRCLHQSNVHTKRKLWGRRAQKHNFCVGAKNPQTCAGLESNQILTALCIGNNGNLRKFGAPYRHGTVFPPKQCAYQKEATEKESPKI